MADTLALEKLFDDVEARFLAENTLAEHVFGWREPARHAVGPRIAWVPGDPAGNLGAVLPARNPGRNPRPLATVQELCTVEISSGDPRVPEDERAQYRAVRLLRDAWHRAAYLAARGTFAIRSETWIVDKKERRHGAALRIVFSIDSMVPDTARETAPVDTGAEVDVEQLDTTERVSVPAPTPA